MVQLTTGFTARAFYLSGSELIAMHDVRISKSNFSHFRADSPGTGLDLEP
jgi:hypothetical protein